MGTLSAWSCPAPVLPCDGKFFCCWQQLKQVPLEPADWDFYISSALGHGNPIDSVLIALLGEASTENRAEPKEGLRLMRVNRLWQFLRVLLAFSVSYADKK